MALHYKDKEFTETDFNKLKEGDDEALNHLYVAFYGYITGILKYKYNAQDAEDIYTNTIMKFRQVATGGNVVYKNIKGYILKMAINLLRENKRKQKSIVNRLEKYLIEQKDEKEDNFDTLVLQEEEQALYDGNAKKIEALKWGMLQLSENCRELLTLTIVKGLKPRDIYERLKYKNARVVTDKKVKCKKQLLKYTQIKLAEMLS